jgi:transposase-like protein
MKHKSKDLKLRAILYYYKSKNQTQTSKIFGCSPRTLMRWVNKFNNCYSFPKNNKMYLGYKLNKFILTISIIVYCKIKQSL